MATITNYPDKKTFSYAELWSADPLVIQPNDWWPNTLLVSEPKGDGWNIGAIHKIDIPGGCWVVWLGTDSGARILQVQQAANGHPLDNAPGPGFLPVEPGVNLITFGDEAPEPPEEPEEPEQPEDPPETPEQPTPQPEPPSELPKAQLITIYAGGAGRRTTPIFHYERYGEKGTDSEFWKLTIVLPGDDYDGLRDKIEQKLLEAMDVASPD